jgi:[ribosomal protein S5]-alanine N-acetyltransferase
VPRAARSAQDEGMLAPDVVLTTDRLVLRPWTEDDAAASLAIFGRDEVTRWLVPAMDPVQDESELRAVVERWTTPEDEGLATGLFAVCTRDDDRVIGTVVVRALAPTYYDLELAWQFAPECWGQGYAIESARAVATWAFANSAHELYAVAQPGNVRARHLAVRLGMQWVGETDKYYGRTLDVYRLRPPDLTDPG